MDILYLLDRLEEELTAGRSVPFTDRKLVDEQECLDILDQIRVAVPEEIKTARKITQEQERMLAETRAEADRMLAEAEQQVAGQVSDHALARAAEAHAAQVAQEARRAAEDVRQQADEYAYRVLDRLHRQIEQIEESVARGMQELSPGDELEEDTGYQR